MQKASSSAMDSGRKAHGTPRPSFPDPQSGESAPVSFSAEFGINICMICFNTSGSGMAEFLSLLMSLWGREISLCLSFLLLLFPSAEFPATAAATSPSHSLHFLVPAFPLRAAVSPSSTGLIQAAGPPADYHSESAESMDEIPVAQTHLGGTVPQGPPKNNSSNSQHYALSTDNPRRVRRKNLYSEHKSKRRSCQQDRHVERDLELFSKIPAVFVSKSSGEPLVPQPQPSESTSEPDHRKCTSKQRVGTYDPCSKDIRTSTTAA